MNDPSTEAVIITGGSIFGAGIDTVMGVRRDFSTFQDYGNLNQGRYAHACGSYLTSSPPDMVPVSSSFMLLKLNTYFWLRQEPSKC